MTNLRINVETAPPIIKIEDLQAAPQRFHGLDALNKASTPLRSCLAAENIRKLDALLNGRHEKVQEVGEKCFKTRQIGAFSSDKDGVVADLLNRKISFLRSLAKCMAKVASIIPMVEYSASKHGLYRAFGVDNAAHRAAIDENLRQVLKPEVLVRALHRDQLVELKPEIERIRENLENKPSKKGLLPIRNWRSPVKDLVDALEKAGASEEKDI